MTTIECLQCRGVVEIPDGATEDRRCPRCGAKLHVAERTWATSASQSPFIMATNASGDPEPEVSEEDQAVLVELTKLQDQRPGWGSAIGILVISLLLYVGAAQRQGGWEGLAIVMAVLAFHESGHYLAMRWFGYRNLRMFFIPFFGAAVSGRHYNVAGWKKALVALAGPVPGILLGIPVAAFAIATDSSVVQRVAKILLIINGFNLLPFLPLDGGWVVHAVLFVRHPIIDALFRVVAAAAMIALGVLMGGWMLALIGVFALLRVPVQWHMANIAHRLRKEGLAVESADAQSIPLKPALAILHEVRAKVPRNTNAKIMAAHVVNVFEALNATPPGAAATLGLLMLHCGSFLLAVVATLALAVAFPKGN
jgi:Zn-dependent protease/DNA-directed RNA polymerase subunit RPC12/RpoP